MWRREFVRQERASLKRICLSAGRVVVGKISATLLSQLSISGFTIPANQVLEGGALAGTEPGTPSRPRREAVAKQEENK